MYQPRDLFGQAALAVAALGMLAPGSVERFDFLAAEVGEVTQALAAVGVVDVDPAARDKVRCSRYTANN